MNTMRNIYATILAALVVAVTVVILLVIWDVIEFDYEVMKKAIWSLLTLFISSVTIMFIFNNLFKPAVKPPKPPRNPYGKTPSEAAGQS